jgi:hypothetical protein
MIKFSLVNHRARPPILPIRIETHLHLENIALGPPEAFSPHHH